MVSLGSRVQRLGSRLLAAIRGPEGRDIPEPKRPTGGAITTVRNQDLWSTYPSTGLTPSKLAGILREADTGSIARAMELAEEIEAKSPRILTGMQTRKRAVQRLDWTVTPASDSAKDTEIADFVRKNLTDCGLRKPVYHLLDAIYKGFAALYVNWRVDGGQIWLGSLDWTPQTRWTYLSRDNAPQAPALLAPHFLTEAEPIYGVDPEEDYGQFAFLLHADATRSTLPHKAGLWRTLVWLWMFGSFSLKDWLVFLDRYGLPFKLGKYPTGMDSAEVDVLKAAVKAAADTGAVINEQAALEIIESKGTGTDMHERLTRYCDEQITLVILGQTASTQGTPNKLGNEEEQGQVRDELVEADAADLAETLRNGLIWPLVGWNYGWDVLLPQFAFTAEQVEDLEKKANTYKILVETGVPIPLAQVQEEFGIRAPEGDEAILSSASDALSNPQQVVNLQRLSKLGVEIPISFISARYGIPARMEGEPILVAPAQIDDLETEAHPAPPARVAAARAVTDDTPITRQAERMTTETTPVWTEIMDRIKQIVDEAESLPALRDALLAAYSDLPTDRLTEVLAMGFAAADLAGRFDVQEETGGVRSREPSRIRFYGAIATRTASSSSSRRDRAIYQNVHGFTTLSRRLRPKTRRFRSSSSVRSRSRWPFSAASSENSCRRSPGATCRKTSTSVPSWSPVQVRLTCSPTWPARWIKRSPRARLSRPSRPALARSCNATAGTAGQGKPRKLAVPGAPMSSTKRI